jgi:lipopolysaccharide/colanic/teichoic acid biosynthesis glycosyltransferase
VDELKFEIGLEKGEITVEMTSNGTRPKGNSMKPGIEASRYFEHKAWPTRILGTVLLVLAAPAILLLVLIVRLTSPGPGLYRQARTGHGGKEFMMYKVRTMYQDAEKLSGPTWCMPGDSRITPLGKVLRFLHLDELPQLINVARGEMDLVGPRPERPCFVRWLANEIPNYKDRLLVLPGITGLAQVNLPPDEELESVRNKVVLDRDYITSASFGLDLRIFMCSFLRMFGIRHGRAVSWLRLARQVHGPANREKGMEIFDEWSLSPSFGVADSTGLEMVGMYNGDAKHNGLTKQNGNVFELHNGAAVEGSDIGRGI